MVSYSGKNVFALVGEESTFNSAAGTIDQGIARVTSISPSFSNNLNNVREVGDREVSENVVGNFGGTISIEGQLNAGVILEMFFGQVSETTTTGDTEHDFVDTGNSLPVANAINSYTLTENFNATSDIQLTYTGVKVNSLSVSVETGGTLQFSSELLAASMSTGTNIGTQDTITTCALSSFNCELQTGDDSSEATVDRVENFSVEFNNNMSLDDVRELGSREAAELVAKNLDVSVEFTKKFDSKTELERFLGGSSPQDAPTPTSMIFSANNGVALGSGRIEFKVDISGGQYSDWSQEVSQEGIVEATFTLTGGTVELVKFTDQISDYFA